MATGALAGCVDSAATTTGSGGAPPVAAPAEVDENTGAIEGIVHDDSLNPIAGAVVAVGAPPVVETVSDATGRFSLSKVPPGTHSLYAQKLGYDAFVKSVGVVVGEVLQADILLVPTAIMEGWHNILHEVGLLGCALSWRPAVQYSGVSACGAVESPYDRFLIVWKLTGKVEEWKSVVFEAEWRSTQPVGAGLSINWEVNGCSNVGTARFARTQGQSPVRARLDDVQLEDRLENVTSGTCGKSVCSSTTKKCELFSRSFSYPDTLGTSSPADVGFTFQQKHDLYIAEFYNEVSSVDFSSIADK
ncbi:MAG: carboxypeptidase regulatory-like domain-containing protein [Euryarchaeota archaeon]|nr:carboxypeptidase regulatory-like domain-containing protein [Euryarchaeota archaeon]